MADDDTLQRLKTKYDAGEFTPGPDLRLIRLKQAVEAGYFQTEDDPEHQELIPSSDTPTSEGTP